MGAYQPKTGERCSCLPGVYRDNCPACEGTGWVIDFSAIRAAMDAPEPEPIDPHGYRDAYGAEDADGNPLPYGGGA
jgi:hypothetical protein